MPRPDRLKAEQPHHKQAFEIYYGLGAKRNYHDAAKQLGLSASALKLMARSFDWRQRIQERDLDAARQIADKTLESDVADHTRHRKLVRAALLKVAKAILEGRVRISVADLDRLIRLEAILTGINIPSAHSSTPDPLDAFDTFKDQLRHLSFDQLHQLAARWGIRLDSEDKS